MKRGNRTLWFNREIKAAVEEKKKGWKKVLQKNIPREIRERK